jgi:TIR domain
MTEPTNAVFLSYASQDAEAARRIADTLRAAGIQIWFNQRELRGGDVWDRHIRDQIQDSRLFIAVISANTAARDEGYFRREWKLAVDRTQDMAETGPVGMAGCDPSATVNLLRSGHPRCSKRTLSN